MPIRLLFKADLVVAVAAAAAVVASEAKFLTYHNINSATPPKNKWKIVRWEFKAIALLHRHCGPMSVKWGWYAGKDVPDAAAAAAAATTLAVDCAIIMIWYGEAAKAAWLIKRRMKCCFQESKSGEKSGRVFE